MNYERFCVVHEETLEWLLDVEDRLGAMEAVPEVADGREEDATSLAEVKDLFGNTAEFLLEVEAQHGAIGKVGRGGKRGG